MRLPTPSQLPLLAVGSGVLLAVFALGLAAWGKKLTKDANRAECAARSAALSLEIARTLDERLSSVAAGERLPEVAAAWRLAEGAVAERVPADAADPPQAWLDEVARYKGGATRPDLALADQGPRGPRAAGFRASGPRAGWLVAWDLRHVRDDLIDPVLEAARDERYRAALLERDTDLEHLGFRPRASTPLFPPLAGAGWQVGVGFADSSALRRNLRIQTALLGALPLWLCLVLVASVALFVRNERERTRLAAVREQFLARATHELQTPLAMLRASVETLQRGAAEGEDRERCLAIIAREEARVTRTTRRLLRYLRLEGASAADVRWSSADAEVQAALDDLRPSLEAAGMTLETDLEELPGEVPGDLLRDTLSELLANARKHAGEGARVCVRLRSDPPGYARLEVSDDGPGLGDDPDALFRPWAQGEGGERADAPGTAGLPPSRAGSGLGLALLREGWALVGGDIAAVSKPLGSSPGSCPEGACFQVRVPVRASRSTS